MSIRPTFAQRTDALREAEAAVAESERNLFGRGMKTGVINKIIVFILLVDVAFIYVYPILYMLSTMMMSTLDLVILPFAGFHSLNWITWQKHLKDSSTGRDWGRLCL